MHKKFWIKVWMSRTPLILHSKKSLKLIEIETLKLSVLEVKHYWPLNQHFRYGITLYWSLNQTLSQSITSEATRSEHRIQSSQNAFYHFRRLSPCWDTSRGLEPKYWRFTYFCDQNGETQNPITSILMYFMLIFA